VLVVADSSPLLYLSRVGLLEFLRTAFGDIVVPEAVWDEIVGARPDAPGVSALRSAPWLRIDRRDLPETDLGLDPGETAAILLAEALQADLLLIDERAGRTVAQGRGLVVRGTLGIPRAGPRARRSASAGAGTRGVGGAGIPHLAVARRRSASSGRRRMTAEGRCRGPHGSTHKGNTSDP
jgi:hypothetical protein